MKSGWQRRVIDACPQQQRIFCLAGWRDSGLTRRRLERATATNPPFTSSYAIVGMRKTRDGVICEKIAEGKLAAIEDPAGTIALCDSAYAEIYGPWSTHPDPLVFSEVGEMSRVAEEHNEGANYAFADGHAKWYRDTKPGMWTSTSID
jgi:prepilin-type processing-associated H-X9-DG protein